MRTLLRKFGFYVLAAWAAVTINFFLPRMLPGNALQALLSTMRSAPIRPDQLKALEAQYGMSGGKGLFSEYGSYLVRLLHGDLGVSTSRSVPVSSLLGDYLPWTLGLLGTATVVAFLLGTFLGIVAGWKRSGVLDAILPGFTFFQAIPYYILAFMLLMTFGYAWNWFPIGGGYYIGAPVGCYWSYRWGRRICPY